MKKRIFIAAAVLTGSVAFAQQKKEKQPPPPPPPVVHVKEVPPPPPPPPLPKDELADDYKAFLKNNPSVKGLSWQEGKRVRVHLKSGKEEVFDLSNEDEVLKLKNKYGELPAPPPPPPRRMAGKRTQS